MISSFDYYKQIETPNMYLCNPDQKPLCAIIAQDRHCALRFNDLSELTFTVPKIDGVENTYNLIETKRLVFVDDIGWFQITNVTETVEGNKTAKNVTAESHQCALKMRGFLTEERVYMFYNPDDPTDASYNASDIGAIPSVVGQLCQQLGMKLALQASDIEVDRDYKEWTIVFIEEELKYRKNSSDNICRTFSAGTTFGYDFIINDAESAFQVIFDFDFLHHTIKIKKLSSITRLTNIYLSFDNLVNNLSITEDAENIVTVLSCNGGDLDIRTVNPMGTNYIVNFDYYKKSLSDDGKVPYPWMSQELISALNEWETEWRKWQTRDPNRTGHIKSYSENVEELQTYYAKQSDVGIDIKYANLKLSDLQVARDQFHTGNGDDMGIVVAEEVKSAGKSLLNTSSFYSSNFSESSSLVGHTTSPTPTKVIDEVDENGNEIKWHYEFSFEDAGQSGTASSLIQNYVDIEGGDDVDLPLYFIDDSTKRTYCKIQVASEVGVVKDGDGFISSSGSVTVRDVTFYVESLSGYFNITMPNGSSLSVNKISPYFTYGGIRYKAVSSEGVAGVANTDERISIYCFYVSGFERYTTYQGTVGDDGWCSIWERYINQVLIPNNNAIQENVDALEAELSYINERCNIQKFIQNKGQTLYEELQHYWIEGAYQNDNLAVLDSTTMSERIDLAKQLMDAGELDLSKSSQPTFDMSMQAVNFIRLLDFKEFTKELILGRIITIEKTEELFYYPALVSIEFDLDSADSFILSFSNAANPNETAMTFADLIQESASTSRTISANWSNLMDYTKEKEEIFNLIMSPLDKTLRAAQENMSNQEFTIDSTGILGRRWDDDSHTAFSPKQVRIINNTMLFTQDNWETASLALGEVELPDGSIGYGLIAGVIVGNLLLGNALNIMNTNSTVTIDDDGITIKNNDGDIVFRASPTDGVEITTYATKEELEDGVSDLEAKYSSLKQTVDGFDFTVYATKEELEDGVSDLEAKLAFGIKTENSETFSYLKASAQYVKFEGQQIVIESTNFTLDKDGTINAQAGQIGGIQFAPLKDTNGLYNDGFMLGTAKNTGTDEYETILAFGDIVYNEDNSVSIYPTTVINEERITAPECNFTYGNIGVCTSNNVKTYSITSRYSDNSNTGIYIGLSSSSAQYRASLSWASGSRILYLRIYDSNGNSVNLTEAKTFTVHYACIWGGDTTWNATVSAGSSYTSIDTNAFWGISYARFDSSSGSSTKYFYLSGDTYSLNVGCRGNFIPYSNNTYSLGSAGNFWDKIYCKESSIDLSDANEKHNILPISNQYDDVYDALQPVTFVFNENTSGRTHIGLTAQNLKDAIIAAGLTTKDCAAYVEWEDEDGNVGCGIRYGELISLNIYEIQKLKARVLELEQELKGSKGENK